MRRSHRRALARVARLATLGLALTGAPTAADEPPRLRLPDPREPAATVLLSGRDPGAPRDLVLWHWTGNRFARLAETRSDPRGGFDFGVFPAPVRGLLLHVAAKGVPPSRDRLEALYGPVPAPRISAAGADATRLSIDPVLLEGELRISDGERGHLLARRQLDDPLGDPTHLDLTAELPRPWPDSIRVQQLLGDGRRSAVAYWRIRPEADAEPGAEAEE